MVITEITAAKFEIEFDIDEVQKLADINVIFDMSTKQLIRKSVNGNLKKFKSGMSDIFNRFSAE